VKIAGRQLQLALVGLAFFCGMCSVSRANGIIDPAMRVLEDEFSNAIMNGTTFAPNGMGGGVFGFYNSTGLTITELTVSTFMATNVSAVDIAFAFVCNSAPENPFFQSCQIQYNPVTGQLDIAFWGTNPVPYVWQAPPTFAGFQKGIPTVPSACLGTPNASGCGGIGHFALSLSDGTLLTDETGGWGNAFNPKLFNVGQPVFVVTELQTTFGATPRFPSLAEVPEPATAGLMAGGFGLMAWLRIRRRRVSTSDPENRS